MQSRPLQLSSEFIAPRPKRRAVNDDSSFQPAPLRLALFSNEDCDSLENNGEKDPCWQTMHEARPGKRQKKSDEKRPRQACISLRGNQGAEVGRLAAATFYEQTAYLIDTLKDDFCEGLGDGQYQLIEDPEQEDQEESVVLSIQTDEISELTEVFREVGLCSGDQGMAAIKQERRERKASEAPRVNQDNNLRRKSREKQDQQPLEKQHGRWAANEHNRFLEALKLFGKSWEKIEKHVGTRDVVNIRAHAQKFLARLVKFLDGKTSIDSMTQEEGEYYFGVLNQKVVKGSATAPGKMRAQSPLGSTDETALELFQENLPLGGAREPLIQKIETSIELKSLGQTVNSNFNKWRQDQASNGRSQASKASLHPSVKLLNSSTNSNGCITHKFSFNSVLDEPKASADMDILSVDSTDCDHQLKYDIDNYTAHPSLDEAQKRKRSQFFDLFMSLGDIDSDDEDPALMLSIPEYGLEFNMMDHLHSSSFMKIFYRIHLVNMNARQPNLYRVVMNKITAILEDSNAMVQAQAKECGCYSFLPAALAEKYKTLGAASGSGGPKIQLQYLNKAAREARGMKRPPSPNSSRESKSSNSTNCCRCQSQGSDPNSPSNTSDLKQVPLGQHFDSPGSLPHFSVALPLEKATSCTEQTQANSCPSSTVLTMSEKP